MADSIDNQTSVLIADDNPWMQRILAKILISYGVKPLFASNAYETLALTLEMKPQAVILDIVMPEISGLQTLRMLKTIGITAKIPVLIITSAIDSESLGQAINFGASGFIRKPFTRAAIFEKLATVLQKEILSALDKPLEKISDAELDAMINSSRPTDHISRPSHSIRRSSLTVTPVTKAEDVANPRNTQPEFNVLHRRVQGRTERNAQQMPDENIVREIIERTTGEDE